MGVESQLLRNVVRPFQLHTQATQILSVPVAKERGESLGQTPNQPRYPLFGKSTFFSFFFILDEQVWPYKVSCCGARNPEKWR